MSLFAIAFPAIDPVALQLGPLTLRWYGLAYMAGLLLAWWYIKFLLRRDYLWPGGKAPMAPEKTDDLLLWATLGVVLGGRLGYVLFYRPEFYLANPSEIPAVWNGGMSFHGGFLGVILATWLFARRHEISFWSLIDACATATPIGLFFGRLANFIGGELYGRVSDVPWAMVFPGAGPEPRHPSQLYEAALEGLVLFAVIFFFTHSRKMLMRPGFIAGVFALGYGLARSFCEFFRQFDVDIFVLFDVITPGILYSLPMMLVGAFLIASAKSKAPQPAT